MSPFISLHLGGFRSPWAAGISHGCLHSVCCQTCRCSRQDPFFWFYTFLAIMFFFNQKQDKLQIDYLQWVISQPALNLQLHFTGKGITEIIQKPWYCIFSSLLTLQYSRRGYRVFSYWFPLFIHQFFFLFTCYVIFRIDPTFHLYIWWLQDLIVTFLMIAL